MAVVAYRGVRKDVEGELMSNLIAVDPPDMTLMREGRAIWYTFVILLQTTKLADQLELSELFSCEFAYKQYKFEDSLD